MEMEFDSEFTVQHVVEAFLAVSIVAVSTAFLLSSFSGNTISSIPLTVIFYSVVPLSMALLGYLTYKVARIMYDTGDEEFFSQLSPFLMSILLAVVAINIGFVLIVSSASGTGSIGTINTSYLIVILSMALSISVLMREFNEKDMF